MTAPPSRRGGDSEDEAESPMTDPPSRPSGVTEDEAESLMTDPPPARRRMRGLAQYIRAEEGSQGRVRWAEPKASSLPSAPSLPPTPPPHLPNPAPVAPLFPGVRISRLLPVGGA